MDVSVVQAIILLLLLLLPLALPDPSPPDPTLTSLNARLSQLSRQVMSDTIAREERVRSDGDSGIKSVRLTAFGDRPYYSESYNRRAFAGVHVHSDYVRVVGLGELGVVLNGVEFRTRHNDYRLVMPSRTSKKYHETEDLPFPPVPKDVTSKETVEEQIVEMQEYFRAWKTQNTTHRKYKDYFKPVLCYMEGAWIHGKTEIEEPFFSDRHHLRATTWFDLLQKTQMTSYTGGKDNLENFAYLPTRIMYMEGDTPLFAQWNYRILCHPLKDDVPLDAFRVVDDMSARLSFGRTLEEHEKTRAARYVLKSRRGPRAFHHGLIDELMEQIPGKDNYLANVTDDSMEDNPVMELDSAKLKNVGYYHRVFRVGKKGAMGTSTIMRGFNDANLFVSLNTRPEIAPMVQEVCKGKGKGKTCNTYSVKATWAIPLEIIYLTPLSRWNPYDIAYKGAAKSVEGKTVYGAGGKRTRNGGLTADQAYDGSNDAVYFVTPSEFFTGVGGDVDPADTAGDDTGVLDKEGKFHKTRASGIYVTFPTIADLGEIRQRYPIAPVHDEGSGVRKELEALKDIMTRNDDIMGKQLKTVMEMLRNGGGGGPRDKSRLMVCHTGVSRSRLVARHTHSIELTADELYDLRVLKKNVTKITSNDNGHEHTLVIKARYSNFMMVECDGKEAMCWDRHSTFIRGVKY